MSNTKMSEENYLMFIACEAFSTQKGRRITYQECMISSIPPAVDYTHGYEIETLREDDYLRIRMYFTLADRIAFSPLRLELTGQTSSGNGDEVYVMVGKMPRGLVDSGVYKFRWIGADPSKKGYMIDMEGEPILFMNGDNIRYVAP